MDEKQPLQNPAPQGTVHAEGNEAPNGIQSLIRMLRILFLGLRLLIILIFVYLLFSGMFRVDDQNEAMLFRFGKLQTRIVDAERGESPILTSGRWYWAWPYPIDWVKEIPAQKSVTISTEQVFEPWLSAQVIQNNKMVANNFLRPGIDGYLITGDTNIVHSKWDVNYRVINAEKYYLDFYDDDEVRDDVPNNKGKEQPKSPTGEPMKRLRGTEAIIRNLLCNAVLAETAGWRIEDIIATTRTLPDGQVENIKDNVEKRLIQLLDEVGLGVQVQSVNLVDLQTPTATMEAFHKVNEASETARALILKARTYADNVVLAAQGQAYQIVDDAKSYRTTIVESIKADSSYFETVLAEYKRNPETMLTTLYTDAVSQALSKAANKYVLHTTPNGSQELRLQIGQVPEKDKNAAPVPMEGQPQGAPPAQP